MTQKRHVHHGRPSSTFFQPQDLLSQLGDIQGSSVLDLGCGVGHISLHASKMVGEMGKVFALDIDQASISVLKSKIDEMGIKNMFPLLQDFSAGTLFAHQSIDLVLIVNVFHGFVVNEESDGVLKELRRILHPQGRVALIEFKKLPDTPGPPLEERLSMEDLRSILEPFGFRQNKTFDIGPIHYGAVFHLRD